MHTINNKHEMRQYSIFNSFINIFICLHADMFRELMESYFNYKSLAPSFFFIFNSKTLRRYNTQLLTLVSFQYADELLKKN